MYYTQLNINGVDYPLAVNITGAGAPTTSTAAEVGMFYMDTTTGDVYKCTAVSGSAYTWKLLLEIVQNAGGSETATMSQKAVTDLVGGVYGADENNLFNLAKLTPNKYCYTNGNFVESTTYSCFELAVESGMSYLLGNKARFVIVKNGDAIVQTLENVDTFTAEGTKAFISMYNNRPTLWKMCKNSVNLSDIAAYGQTALKGELGGYKGVERRVTTSFLENGNLLFGASYKEGYTCTGVATSADTNYNLFENIPVKKDVEYKITPKARFMVLHLSATDHSVVLENLKDGGYTSYTPKQDGYLQLTMYATDDTDNYALYTEGAQNVLPFNKTKLTDKVLLPDNLALPDGVVIPETVVLPDNLVLPKNVVLPDDLVLPNNVVLPETVVLPDNLALPENVVLPDNLVLPDGVVIPESVVLPEGLALPDNVVVPDNVVLPEGLVLPDNVEVPESVVMPPVAIFNKNDVLYGKKWAVLGDSFTNGDGVGTFTEGKYSGMPQTYPYFIGNRTGIEVVKFFNGGRTLAYPADGTFTNSVTCPTNAHYFQNVPEDVDYITIYLGINDSHHEKGNSGTDGEDVTGVIPLGTLADTDTSTYYGAWNVIIPWLMINRPFAHIGIIVSNGCDRKEYRTAQIEIARKYGIPFIDLNGDDRTPVMIRALNSNISWDIRDGIITKKQAVDYDGTKTGKKNQHPNEKAHEYESRFIENFLRSL